MCLGLVGASICRDVYGLEAGLLGALFLLDQVGGQICPCSAISCLNHVRRLISDIQTH